MKLIVSINYKEFVFSVEDGLAFLSLMERAERYENKYRSEAEGGSLHYIYPQENNTGSLKTMPDELYRMAKLAGQPE